MSSLRPETLFSEVDDSVWSPDLQEQFRQALLSANPPRSKPSSRVPSGASASGPDVRTEQPENDPLAELLGSLGGGAGQPAGSPMFDMLQMMRNGPQASTPEVQTSKRDKAIRSLIQLVSTWLLLVYFVFFLEPAAYKQHVGSLDVGRWSRWAVLGENRSMLELLSTFKVQPQPVCLWMVRQLFFLYFELISLPQAFFWAFIALQTAVHFNTIRNTFVRSCFTVPGVSLNNFLGFCESTIALGCSWATRQSSNFIQPCNVIFEQSWYYYVWIGVHHFPR